MWPLPIDPKHKKKILVFLSYKKEKVPSLSTKERKAKFSEPLCYLISPSSYVDIESTDTFFSDLENEYKLLGIKSKQIPKISISSSILEKLNEDKLRNTMIEEFKGEFEKILKI